MDKIAVLSDIHGNLEALKVCLKDIDSRQIKHIICLGDIIAKGVHPMECLALLKERNTLLKEENVDFNHLEIIDEQMIEVQYKIITHRKEMIKKLNLLINDKFQNLDQGRNIQI